MGSPHPLDERRVQRLRKLTEVSRALTYAASLKEVLDLTVQRAAELLDAPKVVLMLAGEDGLLSIKAALGIEENLADRFAEPLTETLIKRLQGLFGADSTDFLGVPLVVNGEVIGILAVGRVRDPDSTEEHEWLLSALADQAAVALEKSRLNEMAEFRERLLSIVGHDLRNPLNAISMAADLLLQHADLPDSQTRLAKRISNSAFRMGAMIDQLSDFTRARLGGGIPVTLAPVDLVDLCRAVLDELSIAYATTALRFEPGTSQAVGRWDRERLSQVISNIVGNAVQYGEPNSPIVVSLREETAAEVILSVQNQGPPIPADLLPQLFDPFRRAASSTAGGHLGLGLYIAQQITQAHGGSISVTSDLDGTTFSVHLPRLLLPIEAD